MDGITCYEVLGVPETATQAEIRKAYLSLIQEVHPDKVPNASAYWKREAERKTQELNEAYAVLRDPERRKQYNAALTELRQEDAQPPELQEAVFDKWVSPSLAAFCCPHCIGSVTTDKDSVFPVVAPCPHCNAVITVPFPSQPAPQPPPAPQGYCNKCGTPLNSTAYCPDCEKFRQSSATPAKAPPPPKQSSGGITSIFQGYAYLIVIGLIFAAFRYVLVALAVTLTLFGLIYFRKFFGYKRRAFIIALVVAIGFLIGDIVYPQEDSKSPTTTSEQHASGAVHDGKYTDWPCDENETKQGYSNIDHRPCKPKTSVANLSDIEIQPDPPKKAAPSNFKTYKVALEYCKTAPVNSGFCYDNGFVPKNGKIVVGEKGVRFYCQGSGFQCEALINDNPISADEECYRSGVCRDANGPIKGAR